MNIRVIPYGQECAIAPFDEEARERAKYPRPHVLPLEPDDAAHFARDPYLDYVIREWRLSDDRTAHDLANAEDMHALTIVFRSGRREPRFHAIPLGRHRLWQHPLTRARYAAESLFREGVDGIEAMNGAPRGLVTPLAELVGLPVKEARRRLATIATVH